MKTLVVLVLLAAVATASPHPRRPTAVEEFVLIPDEDYDTERDSWFGRVPQWFSLFNFNNVIRDFVTSMNPFGDISDLINKGNTTSETQVVNGTVITRNVTTYVDKDTGTVVHVSSVDIHPSKAPVDVDVGVVTEPAGKDPESTEAIDANPPVQAGDIDAPAKESNEIPDEKKSAEETFSLSARPAEYNYKRHYYYPDTNTNYIEDNEVEVFADNEVGDLQNDIHVNKVLEDKYRQSGGMHQLDPDVELIDVTGGRIAETFPNTQVRSNDWYIPEELLSR